MPFRLTTFALLLGIAGSALAVEGGANDAHQGWSQGKSPAGAVQSSGAAVTGNAGGLRGDLPLPSPLYDQASEAVSPLTPDEIRQLRNLQSDKDRALSAPQQSVVPRISALTVDLSPGASLPLLRTAVNYPGSVTFTDSTGAPWNIGAAPVSGSKDFDVQWIPDSPVMVVTALKPWANSNITVYLSGLPVPVVLTVTSGETDSTAKTWQVDSRLDLRLPRRGPQAKANAAPETRIGLHDSTLQAFLDGIPPKEAKRLKTNNAIADTTVWQLGDDLYIRSRAEIRDEFESTLSSADGTHLWKLPVTPYVSFSDMGRTVPLSIELE